MTKERWYIETASPTGDWCAAVIEGPCPSIEGKGKNRRLKSYGSTGQRVREGTPKEINVGLHNLTLDQLRHVYSPDGKFRIA